MGDFAKMDFYILKKLVQEMASDVDFGSYNVI